MCGWSWSLPLGTGRAAGLAFLFANGSPGTPPRGHRALRTVIAWLCEDKSHERDEHSSTRTQSVGEGVWIFKRQQSSCLRLALLTWDSFCLPVHKAGPADNLSSLVCFNLSSLYSLWLLTSILTTDHIILMFMYSKFIAGSGYLLDTVHRCCLQEGGQDDLHLPDRRTLPSISLKAPRALWRHSSNQGDMAGNSPESGNKRNKEKRGQLWFNCVFLLFFSFIHNWRAMLTRLDTWSRVWSNFLVSRSWISLPV